MNNEKEIIEGRFFNLLHPLAKLCNPDASTQTKIKFKGKTYYLIGNLEDGGAIATKEQYENGECSYAHLHADGLVRRFGEVIGNKDDISIESKP